MKGSLRVVWVVALQGIRLLRYWCLFLYSVQWVDLADRFPSYIFFSSSKWWIALIGTGGDLVDFNLLLRTWMGSALQVQKSTARAKLSASQIREDQGFGLEGWHL
jgi:hypothetical protein